MPLGFGPLNFKARLKLDLFRLGGHVDQKVTMQEHSRNGDGTSWKKHTP